VDDKLESGRTLEALRRKNLEGKRLFIEELRRQKTTKSVSLLLEILCDESWFLRELAIGALVESGGLAIEPLRRVLKSGLWYTRAAAARALGRSGDGPSASDILVLLDEPNRTVREAAVDAVQALAANAGTEALSAALADSARERRMNRLSLIGHVAPDLASRLEMESEALLSSRVGAAVGAPAGGSEPPAAPQGTTIPRMSDSADGGKGGPPGAP
jgi:HEAT repeat protein